MSSQDLSIPFVDEDGARGGSDELSNSTQNKLIIHVAPAESNGQSDAKDGLGLSCMTVDPDRHDSDEGSDEGDAGPTCSRRNSGKGATLRQPPKGVNVTRATFLMESSDIYKMTARKRGYCVIINNLDFGGNLEYRHGSKEEGIILEELFEQLGFEVTQVVNATRDQMKSTFEEFAKKPDQYLCDAFIGIILTHGEKDNLVRASDNRAVEVERLIDNFNNKNCEGLIGKPKIFFVQACRGSKEDHGVAVEFVVDAVGEGDLIAKVNKRILPTWGDTVIVYSTVDGFLSNRNVHYGSWFGDALQQIISQHSCEMEFNELMMKVNNMLMGREGGTKLKQSLEIVYRGWAKKLYFNPGLYEA